MKTRQVACIALTIFLVCQIIVIVNAEYYYEGEDDKEAIVITEGVSYDKNVENVGFLEKILHLIKLNEFIITQTGIDKKCDFLRTGGQYYVPPGSGASVAASVVCSSGHGQITVYAKNYFDSILYPKLEMTDQGSFNCIDDGKEKCVVEINCCPHGECSSDSNCVDWTGAGSKCTTRNYVYYDAILQLPKYYNAAGVLSTTYKACTASTCIAESNSAFCSRLGKTCGSVTANDNCGVSRTYNCGNCGSGQTCSNGVCIGTCIPKTCAQLEKNCGSWSNQCGGILNCGTCQAGQTCSNGVCVSGGTTCTQSGGECKFFPLSDCTQGYTYLGDLGCGLGYDCCCVASTCSQLRKTCGSWDNNCGGSINCGTCTSPQTCNNGVCTGEGITPTCSDGIQNQGEIGIDCGGPCSPCPTPTPTVVDPEIKAQIIGITLGDENGELLDTSKELMPGSAIKVSFSIKTTYGDWKAHLSPLPTDWAQTEKEYLVEVGIIPGNVAKDWTFPNPTFTIWEKLSGTATNVPIECCEGMTNVQAFRTTISQNIVEAVVAGLRDDDVIIIPYEAEITIPDQETEDLCPVNGIKTKYWDDTSKEYVLYIIIKNGCTSKEGVLTGFKESVVKTGTLLVDVGVSVTNPSGGEEGAKCSDNFQCQSGICEKHWYGGRCKSGIKDYGISGTKVIPKFPLTREEISKSTSGDLVSAACYGVAECDKRTNYTISCIPVSTLVKDGTMTTTQEGDLFSSAKGVISAGTIGGGAVATFCAIGLATGVWTGGVTTVIGCGIGGALLGIGLAEVTSQAGIKISNLWTPELQQAINSGDSAKVGICTAEPTTTFDIGGILKKIGSTIKITGDPMWDGIIVIIAGVFILMILINMLNRR